MLDAVDMVADAEQALAKFRRAMIVFILIMIILAGAAYGVWTHGYNHADAKWVSTHNKQVKALNKKIAKLEGDSKEEADKLREQVATLQTKLTKISSKAPIIVAHDHKGDVLKCEGKEVVPYLGSDFTDVWNRLNEEGAMK
jgi:hypothetical protein